MKIFLALCALCLAGCSRRIALPPTENYALRVKGFVKADPPPEPLAEPVVQALSEPDPLELPAAKTALEPKPKAEEKLLIPLPEPRKEKPFVITVLVSNVYVTNSAESPPKPETSHRFDPKGLVYAARAGDLDTVRQYLDMGADINTRDGANYGATALIAAVGGRHSDVVSYLLDKGADVRMSAAVNGVRGISPLMVAAQGGPLELVQMLVRSGAEINASTRGTGAGSTALMAASAAGRADIVQYLIYQKATVNTKNIAGRTALMMASQKGHAPCVEALLKASDIQINAADGYGVSALGFARQNGRADVEKILLRAKAR